MQCIQIYCHFLCFRTVLQMRPRSQRDGNEWLSTYHFGKPYNLTTTLHEIASDFKTLRCQPGQYSLGGYEWEVDKRLTTNHKRYILGTCCAFNFCLYAPVSSPTVVSLSMRRLLANVEPCYYMYVTQKEDGRCSMCCPNGCS